MIVVADTGPLLYLNLIGRIGILPPLFGEIVVPEAVRLELEHPRAPQAAREWVASLPSWVTTVAPSPARRDSVRGLDPGEADAILIALAADDALLLLDEWKARRQAKRLGLTVTGTLGVLLSADAGGLIDLKEALSDLERTSFYLSDELLQAALDRARSR